MIGGPAERKPDAMDQDIITGAPGRHWHPLEDGRVQCDLCPRFCRLHEGQRGLCVVRARRDGRMGWQRGVGVQAAQDDRTPARPRARDGRGLALGAAAPWGGARHTGVAWGGVSAPTPDAVATEYWHTLDDGRVQCDVCPRLCRLHEGQRGLCFARARRDGGIVLTTHGRSSGFCVDPIEKKPLAHFLPGSAVLSFGTAGCNLTCKFCQNWDISKAREFDRLQARASPKEIAAAAVRAGCRSVAYTYNDPVIFLEYAVDVAKA